MDFEMFDVIIIGAGPAGSICAKQLTGKGFSIALIEKDVFPRDKICGDALSSDVITQLYKIDTDFAGKFQKFESKQPSNGVRFVAPNGKALDVDFNKPTQSNDSGYIAKRWDFDYFLFQSLKNLEDVTIFQGEKAKIVSQKTDYIEIKTENHSFTAKMVVGADGANSVINRLLTNNTLDKNHHCAGLRQYFENVNGFHPQGHIELHFYKDILPGYFWIFPLPNNQANVGLGMLSSEVGKKKINLKEKLKDIIENHPNVKDRFKDAKPLENIQGFGLPIGSRKKCLSGNRFLLVGDAANLIDPFTGEGIANAIRSGRIAAEHLINVFEYGRFDSNFNKKYDKEIYSKMWNELKIGRSLQNLLKYPRLFNFIVNKASTNESVKILMTSMLDNVNLKKKLLKPSFYFKLFFN